MGGALQSLSSVLNISLNTNEKNTFRKKTFNCCSNNQNVREKSETKEDRDEDFNREWHMQRINEMRNELDDSLDELRDRRKTLNNNIRTLHNNRVKLKEKSKELYERTQQIREDNLHS